VKICKEQAAINQLCDAIELFNRGRYISAITLAAAAEELLVKLLKLHSGNINIPLSSAEDLEAFMFESTKEILEIENYHAYRSKIRNELKHHGSKNNKNLLKGDFKQIALNHIAGAIVNYKTIYSKLPDDRLILEFCNENGLS
jgi:hypothetical protein